MKISTRIIKDNLVYIHRIQLEDIVICKSVQKGVKSRTYDKGRFSVERENDVYHFQTLFKRELKNAFDSSTSNL